MILVVALLFLGPEKLPEAAKTISKGIRDLRKQTRDLQNTIESDTEIGGAIRDIKSALRGEEPPRPRLKPAPLAEGADAAAAIAASTATGTAAVPATPTEPAAVTGDAVAAAPDDAMPTLPDRAGESTRRTRPTRPPTMAGCAGSSAPPPARSPRATTGPAEPRRS